VTGIQTAIENIQRAAVHIDRRPIQVHYEIFEPKCSVVVDVVWTDDGERARRAALRSQRDIAAGNPQAIDRLVADRGIESYCVRGRLVEDYVRRERFMSQAPPLAGCPEVVADAGCPVVDIGARTSPEARRSIQFDK
jgi:hypothetical protein